MGIWAVGSLRGRARSKFKLADQMLFKREALEQATNETVAAYHASLFPVGVSVFDLTAGIGADLIALTKRGPAVGFELDEERAVYARHNLSVHGLEAELHVMDSSNAVGHELAYADPARRVESRRTLDPSEFSPDPARLAAQFSELRLGVIKLSPLLSDAFLDSLGPRLEFLSFGGECREALVICGRSAEAGRFAVLVETGERIATDDELPLPASTPDAFLFDCDPAAVRAHALGTLCKQFNLVPLGTSNGYLSGPELVFSPWLRGYRVLYSGKADPKATRRALRELDGHVFEIKQRGVKADVVRLRKELAGEGSVPVSLVLWPDGASVRHVLAAGASLPCSEKGERLGL